MDASRVDHAFHPMIYSYVARSVFLAEQGMPKAKEIAILFLLEKQQDFIF
jgi:hypothetical protein